MPPEAGLQLLGRQGDLGDLAEQRQQVGHGLTATTPDGQPTEPRRRRARRPLRPTAESRSAGGERLVAVEIHDRPTGASRTRTQHTSTPPAASTTESNPRSVAKALFPAFGFADSEFGCLNAMWNRLDTWGSVAQVRPGLAYVKSRYGTPCAAWDHVRETGQY